MRLDRCDLERNQSAKIHQKLEDRACEVVIINTLATKSAITVENTHKRAGLAATQSYLGNIGSSVYLH